jgi:hypothetical protein
MQIRFRDGDEETMQKMRKTLELAMTKASGI